ncbi:GNAT family N-acetyltransferase [Phormidium sp. CLA17]|uniref:GNAT family N-acetyltransferase n=1 Tax=Leptolyngbya sp. Cla-17 TaxID=2803751 RepID=UPI001490A1B8|nr:GNAT family N-acetyltransferase [Leptolyngbya sp. Cla-17]MBM0741531.1 GNAT family N-acetyltransferase [Leptolyngbya sp. Cla-17]
MLDPLPLPSDCVLRPAISDDKPLIQTLLEQFRREVLPSISDSERTLRGLAIAASILFGSYLVVSSKPGNLILPLVGFAGAAGIGVVVVQILTWNEGWANFWVIEQNDRLVACAKLRCYSRYSVLNDLFVVPELRDRGLGSYLIANLGKKATKPLYLTCLPSLVKFYMRLGFTPISISHLSPLLQFDLGIPNQLTVVPLVMK